MEHLVIGIDLGYGFVKATNGKESIRFPALSGPGRELWGQELFGTTPYDVHIARPDGRSERWFVGELARRECREAALNVATHKYQAPDVEALWLTAAAILAGGSPATVVTGLPFGQWEGQKTDFSDHMKRLRADVTVDGKTVHVDTPDVFVVPQAMGAMMAGLLDPATLRLRHPELLELDGYLCVVDVGTRTTGLAVFETKPKFEWVAALSGSEDVGMLLVHQALQERLRAKAGDAPRLEDVHFWRGLWETGIAYYAGREWNFRSERDQILDHFAERIARFVTQTLGAQAQNRVLAGFAAGGGERLAHRALSKRFPRVLGTPDAQMANAAGFYLFGRTRQAQ